MTKRVENMITAIIRKYGFENEKTIRFCKYAETYKIELLEKIFESFMEAKEEDF